MHMRTNKNKSEISTIGIFKHVQVHRLLKQSTWAILLIACLSFATCGDQKKNDQKEFYYSCLYINTGISLPTCIHIYTAYINTSHTYINEYTCMRAYTYTLEERYAGSNITLFQTIIQCLAHQVTRAILASASLISAV